MSGLRQYVITVIAASILCGILNSIFQGKGTSAALLKLISGLFLAFAVISPVKDLTLDTLPSVLDIYALEAEDAVEAGEKIAADALASIIKEQTEAYILDKAKAWDIHLTVSVTLDQNAVPIGVRLQGNVSPYVKEALSRMIASDLAISKEDQQWIG